VTGGRLAAGAVALVVALALLAAACGGSGSDESVPTTTAATTTAAAVDTAVFAYDASAPLGVRVVKRVNTAYPIAVRDVSYVSGGKKVEAYLALPPKAGKRPGVVFVHGSGGTRQDLLVQAVWLAGRGAVGLAITAPSTKAGAQPKGLTPLNALRRQRDLAVADVVAVRRGLDLLAGRPDVDPKRLGFLGYSAGARTGALLAGVEPRLDALVLWSGGAAPVSTYAARAPASLRPQVRRVLGAVDPLTTIRRARPNTLLLQDGRSDEVVPRAALDAIAAAAPEGTEVRWYQAGHALNQEAYVDQLDWLGRKLRVGPPVAGALKGP
jgi:uncharacterized protein